MTAETCEHKELKHGVCEDCGETIDDDAYAEWASDREVEDGECFRGGEAEAFRLEEQERARRLK
jgi:hypothetical protein